ncbi:MAG: nicotinate (nicotinamide) nucleotide adenylyltransferase [Rubrivivax sp. SCN 71-131]|jgi:nicotinate-nucleotide adenylyltransferase|nr:MAG: nicotinate (nicotinamide) nucleotide adenylyltransferase [Rubrivivax sp. SCN 71-131]
MTERLGLFGGSFDPVHRAHLALARAALQSLRLDRVLWLPAGQPWQKARALTPAAHRVAMLQLALQGEPRFVLDARETTRSGPSYTVQSVRELRAEHPQARLFLLIGQDQFAGFHTWHGWQEILQQVELAVAARPGAAPAADAAVLRHRHRVVPLAPQDVAATTVRARVAAGESIADLVPPEVARYIDRQGLYRAASGS